MKKALAFLIIAGLGGLMAWYGLIGHSRNAGPQQARRQPPPTPVVVETVTRQDISDIRTFSGSIESRTSFVVAPKVAGRLERLTVGLGDAVTPGQLLAVLEDAEYQRQVEQMRAEVAVAQANLEESRQLVAMAQRELERTIQLHATKIASEAELDTARTEFSRQKARLQVAEAQVEQKIAGLQTAELRMAYTRIHVPEMLPKGLLMVAERFVDAGSLLSVNSPILRIVDLAALVAVIHVTEKEYARIHSGQPARITSDGFLNQVFAGRITARAPMLHTATRKARVEIELDNMDGHLKPGMFSRVAIEFDQRQDVPVVPLVALVQQYEQEGVFVAHRERGQAVFVPLKLGLQNTRHAEVLEVRPPVIPQEVQRKTAQPPDLDPAEIDLAFLKTHPVVVAGQHLLHDGAPLLITVQDGQPVARRSPAETPSKGQTP